MASLPGAFNKKDLLGAEWRRNQVLGQHGNSSKEKTGEKGGSEGGTHMIVTGRIIAKR